MTKRETLATRLGEMLEQIDCHAIANGTATPAKDPITSFEEALKVR
jgi:hypothetical protein